MNPEGAEKLRATAQALAAPGKGILAADESTGTIGKRFSGVGLPNDEETRRAYREILVCADIGSYISGIIMFEESLMQKTSEGELFTQVLTRKGVLPGIKVDTGLKPMDKSPEETLTSGLDGLDKRCEEFYRQGARFTKWRAALKIDEQKNLPSDRAVRENAVALAKYAKISQEQGLVPIVEPEILIDGVHGIETSAKVAKQVITACYRALHEENVMLSGTLLKPMMIMPGISNSGRSNVTADQIARATIDCMCEVVPKEVPGIMFLSGGLSEVQATEYLDAINCFARKESLPWRMSFSYGRALQTSVLKVWAGKPENAQKAMKIAAALAEANSKAQLAEYRGSHHPSLVEEEQHEGFRGWHGAQNPVSV